MLARLAAGLALSLALVKGTALACSCLAMSIAEEYAETTHVFVGTVTASTPQGDGDYDVPVESRFAVTKTYKGRVPSELTVHHYSGGGGMCGLDLTVGEQYVVFAYEYKGKIETSICSRTAPTVYATDTLAWLELNAGSATKP